MERPGHHDAGGFIVQRIVIGGPDAAAFALARTFDPIQAQGHHERRLILTGMGKLGRAHERLAGQFLRRQIPVTGRCDPRFGRTVRLQVDAIERLGERRLVSAMTVQQKDALESAFDQAFDQVHQNLHIGRAAQAQGAGK